MEEDCIFCKIVKGEIPCHKIWEDEDSIAFLDINPVVKGHTIIIPKIHTKWIWDMGDEEYSKLMMATKTVAGFLRKAFETDCIQESVIGFDMHHTHVHLFPRTDGDGLPIAPTVPIDPKPTNDELAELAKKIRE